ncbi:MAG TPA: alpha-ketoacid dehydrogenase subunit beta [Planctomycetes bacterium]|nr:alpha-ketoacid dehydrogenase subunit beta [Planctomycetota bacterium]
MAETITYLESLQRALRQVLKEDPKAFLIGEDIGAYGGAFKLTDGFLKEFGEDRIIDTPIVETGLVGAAIGASMAGLKPIVEMQFIDFISCTFNQLTNFAATCHFRWGQNVPIVVRGPSGGGVHAGPFHSQMVESFFLNTPGIKIVVPATVTDVHGMLLGAVKDPNPVLFLEQKGLYRTLKEEVSGTPEAIPPGVARLHREGDQVSIITWGAMLHRCASAAKRAEEEDGISCEILDLRSLCPLDLDAIYSTVRKTGKVLVIHEDNLTGGAGAEISARIVEHCFEDLDAPVRRVAALDVPIPLAAVLEDASLPDENRILDEIRDLVRW